MKLAVVVVAAMLALPLLAADVNGKWKATVEGPDGKMEITFDLKADGQKVTGTATGPLGELPITEGKLDGDAITFTVASDQFKVVHKGTVSGDEMRLKVDIGEQSMEIIAKRVKS